MKPEDLEDVHIVNVLNALAREDVEWAKGVPDCYRGHLKEAAVRLMRYRRLARSRTRSRPPSVRCVRT